MNPTANPRKRPAMALLSPDKALLDHHPGLYRATLSCRIGCAALEGTSVPPGGVRPSDYALFNLINAAKKDAQQPTSKP